MEVEVSYRGKSHTFVLPPTSTIATLKEYIHKSLNLSPDTQRLLAGGKQMNNTSLVPGTCKFMLLASSADSISAIKDSLVHTAPRQRLSASSTTRVNKTHGPPSPYTFTKISSLGHLPDHFTAQSLLERLARDAAIVKLMNRHKLRVGLLTELDPRLYTSHESKVLGLNRNGGAEILLRVRTDEMDGWRDYRTVRATLVHELTHNTYTEHDRRFWDLFHAMSREVAEMESGRAMRPGEVYIPPEALESDFGAEWTGGTEKLGSGPVHPVMDEREARANAAEERSRARHE